MEQCDRCAGARGQLTGQQHCIGDKLLSSRADQKAFELGAFPNDNEHWRVHRFDGFICFRRAQVKSGRTLAACADDCQIEFVCVGKIDNLPDRLSSVHDDFDGRSGSAEQLRFRFQSRAQRLLVARLLSDAK